MADTPERALPRGLPFILLGLLLASLARAADGFVQGALQGAGVVLMVAGAYVVGASFRTRNSATKAAGAWLPSRDGEAPTEGTSERDER